MTDEYTTESNAFYRLSDESLSFSSQSRTKWRMDDEASKYDQLHDDVFKASREAYNHRIKTIQGHYLTGRDMMDLYKRTHLIVKHHTRRRILL